MRLAVDFGSQTVRSAHPDHPELLFSSKNTTVKFGVDILSRASCAFSPSGSSAIRSVAVSCIKSHMEHFGFSEAVVAGNSVMEHLFHGYPVVSLVKHPFTVFSRRCFDDNGILFLPSIKAFIGSDAFGIIEAVEDNQLGIDMGTNCEMVVKKDGRYFICSVPAGPALEGGNTEQGMSVAKGAICSWEPDDNKLNVIGNTKPQGYCGSVFLKALYHMRVKGILDDTGFLAEKFMLCPGVGITQQDVRAAQLALAAMKAGISILQKFSGVDIFDSVVLSGNFGGAVADTLKKMKILPGCSVIQKETVVSFLASRNSSVQEWEDYCIQTRALCRHVPPALMKNYELLFLDEIENLFKF